MDRNSPPLIWISTLKFQIFINPLPLQMEIFI